VVVVSEKIIPTPEWCDRFRCELLGVWFGFTARHSQCFIAAAVVDRRLKRLII